MGEAPERIWAQDAQPDECNYIGGGWWDDECGNTQYPNMVEYLRADLAQSQIAEAERRGREAGIREAADTAEKCRLVLSQKQREAFQSGSDVQGNRLHTAQCAATDIQQAILALLPEQEDKTRDLAAEKQAYTRMVDRLSEPERKYTEGKLKQEDKT